MDFERIRTKYHSRIDEAAIKQGRFLDYLISLTQTNESRLLTILGIQDGDPSMVGAEETAFDLIRRAVARLYSYSSKDHVALYYGNSFLLEFSLGWAKVGDNRNLPVVFLTPEGKKIISECYPTAQHLFKSLVQDEVIRI